MIDSVEQLEARAGMYAALALGLDYPSDPNDWDMLVASLRSAGDRSSNDIKVMIPRLAQAIVESRTNSISPAEEHTFLFARQTPCPPRESAFVDTGRSHVLADVAGFYRAFGFQVANTAPQLPDHICSQLEFMAVLCAKQAYALQQGWTDQAEICQEARRTFLEEHLGRWIYPWSEQIRRVARLPLYPALAALVQTLLADEAERLKVRLSLTWKPSTVPDEESEIQCAV